MKNIFLKSGLLATLLVILLPIAQGEEDVKDTPEYKKAFFFLLNDTCGEPAKGVLTEEASARIAERVVANGLTAKDFKAAWDKNCNADQAEK